MIPMVPSLTHAAVPCCCDAVTCVETQTASTTAAHHGQPPSSREHPYGDDHPFPVHQTTEQVSYSFHPAIFVAQYGMPMGCGRSIHDGGVRLHPGSGYGATHRTGGETDARMAAYPSDLPSIRESRDIQDALLFGKPYGGLHGRPVPFDTLKIEISLTHKGREVWARHSKTFMVDVGNFLQS